jgi:methyl-accepting chemotaxis protein
MIRTFKHFWTASISRQLMLGIALVHAVLMTIFVFDLVGRQSDFLVEESGKQAVALAETLAANGTSWILSNDIVGMEEVINSQRGYPGLRYAMFLGLDGQVLGFSDRSEVGRYVADETSLRLLEPSTETQVLVDSDQLIDAACPVLVKGRQIGWARVGISRGGIVGSLALVTNEGLLYTVFAILVGVLFAWLMGRSLTRDIRQLADVANRIHGGGRDVHTTLDRPDELGRLSADLNRMLHTLGAREQDLTTMHQQAKSNEERLSYAMAGASDGLWDWNLVTDEVYFSPRWKSMLGYAVTTCQMCSRRG